MTVLAEIQSELEKLNLVSTTNIDNFDSPDIILLQCPAWGIENPPLSLAVLSAQLRKYGHKVLPLDLNNEFYHKRTEHYKNCWNIDVSTWFWEAPGYVDQYIKDNLDFIQSFANLLIKTGCKFFGFSVYSSCLPISIKLAGMLKEIDPSITTIFGGPNVSKNLRGLETVVDPNVDMIVEGEGELTILELMARQKQNLNIYETKGIFYSKDNENVIFNERMPLIKNLDELPFADFSDFDYTKYDCPDNLPIMGSRGCPNNCSFCSERAYWETFRTFSPARVVKEIIYQKKNFPTIEVAYFQDSLVNGHIEKLKNFAQMLIVLGLDIRWKGQAVIRKEMDYEFFKLLKRSKCDGLGFGLETTSKEIMIKNGKNLAKHADVQKIVRDAARADLICTYNFMFGLPGESEEDHKETLRFVEENKDYIKSVNPSPGFCGFSAGTPGGDNPEKFGIVEGEHGRGGFWESEDGTNTFLVRVRRFEDFSALVHKLGIKSTYNSPKLLNREKIIGDYHYLTRNYSEAVVYLSEWVRKNPRDLSSKEVLEACKSKIKESV